MAQATELKQGREPAGPRCIAIVGPFQSGKTTLLESILARAGALQRMGNVAAGTSVGDGSPEARAHKMSVEPNIATCDYLGESFTFIDCPGSVELLNDMQAVLPVCDAAIVVCEADPRKVPALQLILHQLEDLRIPRFLFLNKIDTASARVRETLQMLQPASRTQLLLRQIPIWKNGIATGFIDLALERAFIYREYAPSEQVAMPDVEIVREKEARFSMLERLADYDDTLMEHLIEEMEPPRDRVFADLAQELRDGHVMPMLIGAAARGNGVTRLLKALRHEAPGLSETRARLEIGGAGEPLAHILRSVHTAHGGKLSVSRVLRGSFPDNATVRSMGGSERIAGMSRLFGGGLAKVAQAGEGETIAFARLESFATGDAFSTGAAPKPVAALTPPQPVLSLAISVADHKDDAKLSSALAKLHAEDPALIVESDAQSGALSLHGQGEMHLRLAQERLSGRFGLKLAQARAHVAYRETIRSAASARGRHRKQSGGHGQFGDVVLEIKPLPRGSGLRFVDKITGGVVPRGYIPSVEDGVRDYCKDGPLGFPVVDIEVTLLDGSYHSVDSSDMAFKAAARLAMIEAMGQANPVLLEPILQVDISVPSEALARANALVSARRGHILGYASRPGWDGWEVVEANVPAAEIGDLVVELRSATAGVGSFTTRFDHLAELVGKAADQIVEENKHRH